MAVLHGLLALLLLGLAAHGQDPLTLPIRPYAAPGLILAGAALAFRAFRARQRPPKVRRLLVLLSLASIVIVLGQEALFQYRRQVVLSASPAALEWLGRHVIAGFADREEAALLAERGAVGGFFITRRNALGLTADQLRRDLDRLQSLRRRQGLCPLIFATDQEGGPVSRLSPPLTTLPSLSDWIAAAPTPAAVAARAREYGDIQGRELAGLGIAVNFSPVVDLKIDHGPDPLDFNSLIARRAISDNPDVVANAALHYALGLAAHGVTATLKHFPGLGRVRGDTHHFSADFDRPAATLAAVDWVPFRRVLGAAPALMMLSHVRLKELDPDLPVSYSARVIGGLIRGDWGFDGVLVTDDLTMAAVYRSPEGLGEAAVRSLAAGNDLLLVSYDGEKVYEVLYALLRADEAGRLEQGVLERSAGRLRRVLPDLQACALQ
jgi:beta-N-acetylhexosaminidase